MAPYDPINNSTYPQDLGGHGTHVTGLLAGQNGIGVAPGAKWMSCNALSEFAGTAVDVIACGQWIVCPTLPDGVSDPNCDKTPHLVSNSWGFVEEFGETETFYSDVILACSWYSTHLGLGERGT